MGSSSKSGQGAEEYVQDITDVEEVSSDLSLESENEAELDACFESLRAVLQASGRVDSDSFVNPVSEMISTPGNPPAGPPSQGIPFGMQIPGMSSIEDISHDNPMVEVLRDPLPLRGKLKLNIACMNRPGLLKDLLGVLKLKDLDPVGGGIVCRNKLLFANLDLQENNLVAHPEPLPESEEDEALKELLLRVIRQETQDTANSDNNEN